MENGWDRASRLEPSAGLIRTNEGNGFFGPSNPNPFDSSDADRTGAPTLPEGISRRSSAAEAE